LKFPTIFSNKQLKTGLLVAGLVILVYLLLRVTIFKTDPVLPVLREAYKIYLLLPERIANLLFHLLHGGVHIVDHRLVYQNDSFFLHEYRQYIENWQTFLLYKRWSVLLIAITWLISIPILKKLRYTLYFLFIHLISIIGGLFILGIIGPRVISKESSFFLSPTLIGNLFMYLLFFYIILTNKHAIRTTFKKIGIKLRITNRQMNEFLVLLLILLVLRNYIIAFFSFRSYVIFLLDATNFISSLFGYTGVIDGDQLVGENGALALSKHCLGFMTMYLFGALVYLTRIHKKKRVTYYYMAFGMSVIFIMNLIRLVLVFIVAQGENGYARASLHHEVYNIGIYIIVFALWVFWFEFVRSRVKEKKIVSEDGSSVNEGNTSG